MCGGCLSVCLQEQGVGVCLSAGPGRARAGLPAGERREPLCLPGSRRVRHLPPSAPGKSAPEGVVRGPRVQALPLPAGAAAPLPAGSPPRRALPRAAARLPPLPPAVPSPRLRIAAAGAHAARAGARPRMLPGFCSPAAGRGRAAGPGCAPGRAGAAGRPRGPERRGPGEAANKSVVQNGARRGGLDPFPAAHPSAWMAGGSAFRPENLPALPRAESGGGGAAGAGGERGQRRGALSRAWGWR